MIITITNQKGGSCKTSTSILISLALAARGGRVLVVDTDPQRGLSSYLVPDYKGPGTFELIIRTPAPPVQVNRGGLQLDLYPADHRLDKVFASCGPYDLEQHFKKTKFDYIVIDTPPTVQGITRAAAFIANRVIIPADISPGTIAPTLYTLEALRDMKKAGKVYLIGREPEKDAHGFQADTAREFIAALDGYYGGTLPRSVAMQKAVAGGTWTRARIAKILTPILDTVEL